LSSTFDVFRLNSYGTPVWCGIATDVESACQLIRKHAGENLTRFMVFSRYNKHKTFYEASKDGVVRIGDNVRLS